MTSPTFCGDMPMRLASLWRRDPKGGVPARFAGRRVSYSINTRAAIRAVVDLLGLLPGDEVLVPSYNCGSELDPLLQAGLALRLYPSDGQGMLQVARLAPLITACTRAVYMTHPFGFPQPQAAALRALCDQQGLALIEDCALNLLSGLTLPGGQPDNSAGQTGDVALFCFYKFFPTLAGGALVINADRIRTPTRFDQTPPLRLSAKPLLRAVLDMTLGAERVVGAIRAVKPALAPAAPATFPPMPTDYHYDPDLSYGRISRITARQLASFDVAETILRRRANYRAYLEHLSGVGGVTPLFPDLSDGICPLSMPVLLERRVEVARALRGQGIAATAWWAGYHPGLDYSGQPEACQLKNHVLVLPCHQDMTPDGVRHVCTALRALVV